MYPAALYYPLKEVNNVLKGLTTEIVKLERRLWQTCIIAGIGSAAIIAAGVIVGVL